MKTTAPETRMIALAALRVADWNARKTIDLATLAGLTESIKLHKMQVPLIVRPLSLTEYISLADAQRLGDGEEVFEIVAGHRRFKAAAILKLAELPCIVRELNDDAAREIGLIDNLQREDVPAMEEAEAFGELLDRLHSIAAVAARVGKEQAYVAKRLKLRTCTEHTRRALAEQLIIVDHALLLARLGEGEQNQALKWCLNHNASVKVPVEKVIEERIRDRRDTGDDDDLPQDGDRGEDDAEDDLDPEERAQLATPAPAERPHHRYRWEPQSVLRLKEHIECETGTPLDRAPWLDAGVDNFLKDAPLCEACPQNTKANAPLFGDLDMGVAVCTDGGCFKRKTAGFVELQVRCAADDVAAKAKIPGKTGSDFEILRVSWKQTSTVPRQLKDGGGVNPAQVFKDGQWVEATKKCEHARAAVTVDWRDPSGWGNDRTKLRKPGEIVQACIEPKCKVHPKEWAKPKKASANSESSNGNSEQARANRERKEAAAKAENEIRGCLVAAAIAGVGSLSKDLLRKVVLLLLPSWLSEEDKKRFPGLKKSLETSPVDSVSFARAAASLFFVAESDESYFLNEWDEDVTAGRKELLKLLAAMGWKGADPWAKPEKPTEKPAVKKALKKPAKKTPAKKAAKKGGKR